MKRPFLRVHPLVFGVCQTAALLDYLFPARGITPHGASLYFAGKCSRGCKENSPYSTIRVCEMMKRPWTNTKTETASRAAKPGWISRRAEFGREPLATQMQGRRGGRFRGAFHH